MSTFGNCDLSGTNESLIEGVLQGSRFQTPADVQTLTNIRVYIRNWNASARHFKVAVYSNVSDKPSARLWQADAIEAAGSSLTTYNFALSLAVSPSTWYWFIVWGEFVNGGSFFVMSDSSATELQVAHDLPYDPHPNPSFPNPFPSTETFTYMWHEICVTYTPVTVAIASKRLLVGVGL